MRLPRNYAVYCGAVAAGVLLLLDIPQPSNYGAEGYRVLWTLCGVGIAVVVADTGCVAGRAVRRYCAGRDVASQEVMHRS